MTTFESTNTTQSGALGPNELENVIYHMALEQVQRKFLPRKESLTGGIYIFYFFLENVIFHMALEQVQRKALRKNESARGFFLNCNLLILLLLDKLETKYPRGVTTQWICDHMPPDHTKNWRDVNNHLIDLEKQGMIRKEISPFIPKYSYFSIDEAGKRSVRDILHDKDTRYKLEVFAEILPTESDYYNNYFCCTLNPFS